MQEFFARSFPSSRSPNTISVKFKMLIGTLLVIGIERYFGIDPRYVDITAGAGALGVITQAVSDVAFSISTKFGSRRR